MSIDYTALDKVLGGGNTDEPLLGATEIDPQTGLTLSEEGTKSLQSHLAYGNPIDVYPGPVDKATLRVLGEDGYYPQHGDEYTRYQMARKQSSFGQSVNAMNQAIVGEIIGGTIEGVGYMLDGKQYVDLIRGEEEEFGNALSEVGKSLKSWAKKVSPVSVSPGAKEYDPGNWAWWMSNFPSVASTLSLMIPSAGIVRGVGALAKLAGVAKGMGRTGKWMATGISQAVVSRHMENLMEASGVFKEELDYAKSIGMSEDEAKKYASVAASNTYAKQWWMLAQDVPQYLLLNRLGGMGKQATSMKVAKAMGIDPGKTIATKSATILRDMVGEGGEEMFQYLVNEQSSLLAQRTIDPNVQTSMSKVWQDKYDSGEMWTAATFGALGAGVMQAGFAGFNAKAIQASNKARIQELQGRGQVFKQAYEEYQNALNSGDPIRTRQALGNLEISLAINAEAAGNENDLISALDRMTNDPNDEIFERYNIDPQQGTILKDNPDIAKNIKATVKRVKELKRSFERENNLNKNIKGEQKKQEIAHLMTWNQLMLEKTKTERETLEQELNDMSASSEKLNSLTPQGKKVKELEGQVRAIKNPGSEIGSEDPYKKPGVIDVLEHRLKTQGNNMEELEKALFEYNIELQKRDLTKVQGELKQAQEEYTEELQTQDKEVAVTDDELVPLMSHKLRIKWVDAAINDLNKRMENYRAGTPLRDETVPVEDKKEDATEEKYDPEVDIHVNDVVSYIDKDGNVQKGRVLEVDIANVDSEGNPIGAEGDNADNVYRIQPLDKNSKPDGSPIVKFGLNVALDKKARIEEDTSTTVDPIDEDVQIEMGIAGLKDDKSNQGTLTPVLNLAYSHREGGTFVIRDEKLGKTLSDPNTSYDGSESELSTDLTNPYLKTIRFRTKARIKLLEESGENKKELGAQRRMLTLVNKLIQGKYLTEKEINDFIAASKKTPLGNALDQMPISVGVTIEGVEYKDGLFMHSTDFDYIKIPSKILRKMQRDPKAKETYLAQKMKEARSLRNAILRYTLAGKTLYSQDLKVGRGSPNTLSKSLSIDERKRNIATALGVKPGDIKFAVAKAQAANPYYSTIWSGENTRIPGVRFGKAGNMFVITNQTINGKNYALKINVSKLHKEHADILLDAFRLVGIVENEKKAKAWRKYKTDGKVNKNARYSFKWAKQYDKVSGILPAELIDLLVAHGKELTDPNSASFKTRLRNEKHKIALLQKTLYLETTKSKAVLYYGYNPKTEAPYEINLLESKSINEHRIPFIEWARINKNYAAHISKRSLGLELNGDLLNNRPFTIGVVNKIERKAGEGYNDVLINNMMVTTDVEKREDNGLIFGNPILNLNVVDSKGQLNLTTKEPEVTETEVIKAKQPKPKAKPAKSEPQKQAEKKPKVETTESLDFQVKKLENDRDELLNNTTDPAEKKRIKGRFKYRIDKLKTLHAAAQEKKVEEKKSKNPLDDIRSQHKIAMEATEEEPVKKIDIEKEIAWIANKVNMARPEVVPYILRMAGTGRRAFALYGHDATLLYEGAAEGALYHEAWHRVSLGYLTKAEREALYRTARQVYKMEDAADKDIEERLAEEFREFVLLKEKKDKPIQHTGIRKVFQRIYDWIKNVFAGPSRLRENDIDRMFQQIYAGKYSNATVLESNINNISTGEYAMAVGRHKFETITSSKHRKDIVKMLADKTLQLNEIEDLNSLRGKDRIKAEPFFEWLGNTVDALGEYKYDDLDQQARADQLRLVLKEVNKNKAIFWDMINDYFSTLGIEARDASLSELDIEQLEREGLGEVGTIDVDKRSSYEVSSKDNAMTSIKFLVARLHESQEIDPTTGIQPYIEFNQVWSSLLLNLNMFEDIEDMIEELKVLGAQENNKPWFTELANELENGSEILQNQFLTTFNLWKHDFITFEFTNTTEGAKFRFIGNSQNELSRNSVLRWNEEMYLDEDIVSTSEQGEKILNADFFVQLEKRYQTLLEAVEEDVEVQNIEEEFVNKHIAELVTLFNTLHISIDSDTIQYAINEIYEDETDLDSLFTMLDSDLKKVFGRESELYKEAVMREDTEDEDRLKIQSAFITNPVLYKSSGKSISGAYAMAHPELQENVVIGAEGNKYFTYAQNNMATDIVRKLKRDDDFLATRRTLMNNTRSRVLRLLAEDTNVREAFYLRTYSALKESHGGDRGRNFKQVAPLEEYLIRFNAIEAGYLPLPIMANRKQFYFMSGIPILKDVVTDIKIKKGKVELSYSDEAMNLFYDYFLDEKERVLAAHDLRDEYNNPETTKERKVQIKKTFIKNYHYAGDLDLTAGNAYNFIHFKAFNSYKDPKKINTLSEAEIKEVIKGILNSNFKLELEYASKIGAIERSSDNTKLDFDALYSREGRDLEAILETEEPTTDAVVTVLGGFMINNMMSIIESEKVFFADPAFFAKDNKDSVDVADDMYKRWFGVGSTGMRFAKTTESAPDSTFGVITLQTQKLKSIHYRVIFDHHVELYKKLGISEEVAKKRATIVLDALTKVDPTDGSMLVSPEMFRSMSIRLGKWSDSKEDAFNLLMKEGDLTPEEEIAATGIVMQPLKTVYVGKHAQNGLDVVIYDKMSMATIFRKQVKGGPLEEVLDRMEAVGKYEGLEKVHAFKYDTATKVGGIPGVKLFTNGQKRDKVNDLSKAVVQQQLFDNLKYQVVTDAHDVVRQVIGTQAYKVVSSNIHKDQTYGEYATGDDLLEALTSSREALSGLGKERVRAKLGMKGNRIDNKRFIAMLSSDAKQAKKSYDFIQALRVEENGELYLELDAFTDRKWVYDRIMSLIGKETVDLEMPGNQLIQVSDYGFSYDSDLSYSHPDEEGNITELEVRVSTSLFKNVIPNYKNLTHEQREAFLTNELKLIGYRVPVQGQNSTVRLKVKGFLRENAGDVIHLPLEFTALTGSDFDIDKLFVIGYNYDKRAKKRGRIEKVPYLKGVGSISIDNRYREKTREIYRMYSTHPEVIGEELFDKINAIKRLKKTLGDSRSTLYADLDAAKMLEREIFEQLQKGAGQELIDEHIKVVERIASLEDEIGIETDFLDATFEAETENIQSALIAANVLPTREAFGKLTIEEQNTREANENRILDIFDTVLGDDLHYLQTSSPLGVLTGNLKQKAKQFEEDLEGKRELNSLETTTPYYQSRTREIFIGADQGIGAFALSNAHHGLTQHANFGMKSEIRFGFEEEGSDVMWFNKINGEDGRPIMDWLSALIDAHVDAAKDPYIIKLNVNNSTFDVVNLMIRAGVGETTFDFISQPILREFAQEFVNATGQVRSKEVATSDEENPAAYAYSKIMERWADYLGVEADEFESDLTLASLLNSDQLQGDIKKYRGRKKLNKADQSAYYVRQMSILKYFTELSKDAKDLTRVVMASRIDTKKYGSTPVRMRQFLNSIYNLEASDKFVNLNKLIRSDGVREEGGTMLSTLLKNSVLFGLEVMADKSIYGSYGFSAMFGKVLESLPSGYYANDITLNAVTEELFALLASEFFVDKEEGLGINKDGLKKVLGDPQKSVFAQIQAVKTQSHKHYEALKDNKFLNMMIVDFNENLGFKWYLRTPFRTLNDRWDTDDYIDDYLALTQSESPEVRELARILYVYSFFTTGWRQRRHSFHTYTPTEMNKEMEVSEGKYVSYNEFIKKLRRRLSDPDYSIANITSVKRHLFRNNWFNQNFVPKVSEDITNLIETKDKRIGMEVEFKLNKSQYKGRNKDGMHIFTPYILVEDDEGIWLMEYAGYNKKTIQPIYRIVPRKGFLDMGIGLREYGLKTEKSILKSNAVDVVTEAQFIKMMEDNEDMQSIPFESQEVTDKTRFEDAFFKDFTRMDASRDIGIPQKVTAIPTTKVISGGQTGVDRLGLEAAKVSEIETGGVAAPGMYTETGSDLSLHGFNVREITAEEQAKYGNNSFWTARTQMNAVQSDGTIYFNVAGADKAGYYATKNYAEKAGKPFLLVDETANPDAIREWLVENDIKTLNVAGNRASKMTTTQNNKVKEILVEVFTGQKYEIVSSKALSTSKMPIRIFTDGSSTQKTNTLGYGAFFTWNGKKYEMSGTNSDVNRVLKNFEGSKPHSPTVELIGMLEALRKFSNTAEHIYILTDNENNVNYEGIWDRAVVNEFAKDATGTNGKRKKATKPNVTGTAPWMEYIVPEIVKVVEKIEENGGSVRFQWIPGHISNDKANQYPHAFSAEDGAINNNLVEQYKLGNNAADALAASTTKKSNFRTLGAPEIESISELRSKAEDKYSDRSQNNNPLC